MSITLATIHKSFDATNNMRINSKGLKWPGLFELIEKYRELIQNYDYIWLPDEDLDCNCEQINRLFEISREYGIALAQPSLTPNSYFSHLITLHNPCFRLRYTSIIEIMAPCFRRDALFDLLPTFNGNLSGFGLDYVWPELLARRGFSSAIIDDIQVRHTRPVGGGTYYRVLAEQGANAWDELHLLVGKYGLKKRAYRTFEAVLRSNSVIRNPLSIGAIAGLGLLWNSPKVAHWTRSQFARAWLGLMRQQLLRPPKPGASGG